MNLDEKLAELKKRNRLAEEGGGTQRRGDTLPDDTGNTGWSVSSLPLQNGANVITVTAYDAAGNSGSASVTVSSA